MKKGIILILSFFLVFHDVNLSAASFASDSKEKKESQEPLFILRFQSADPKYDKEITNLLEKIKKDPNLFGFHLLVNAPYMEDISVLLPLIDTLGKKYFEEALKLNNDIIVPSDIRLPENKRSEYDAIKGSERVNLLMFMSNDLMFGLYPLGGNIYKIIIDKNAEGKWIHKIILSSISEERDKIKQEVKAAIQDMPTELAGLISEYTI